MSATRVLLEVVADKSIPTRDLHDTSQEPSLESWPHDTDAGLAHCVPWLYTIQVFINEHQYCETDNPATFSLRAKEN